MDETPIINKALKVLNELEQSRRKRSCCSRTAITEAECFHMAIAVIEKAKADYLQKQGK